jgi:flagellar hook assembly protein FlgD
MYREVILSSQTGIEDSEIGIATNYQLEQNYPNPFNPSTSIEYYIPSTSDVKVEIYNLLGSKITSLFEGKQSAGSHTLTWNGKDQSGNPVASGIYFYKLSTPNFSETKKMMLMK